MTEPETSSRLQLMQARFQQKQLQEKEQKLLQLYDQQQQRAHQVAQRGSAGSNAGSKASSNASNASSASSPGSVISNPAGKVRQMFDERRQNNAKGIDKSYPLEPLDAKSKRLAPTGPTGKPANGRRAAVVGPVKRAGKPSDASSDAGASSRTLLSSQRDNFSRESCASSHRPTLRGDSAARRDDGSRRGDYEEPAAAAAESMRRVNGQTRTSRRYEINIDEVIDNEAMERNRMLAKFQPIDVEKRRRFSADVESGEFPVETLRPVPDKAMEKSDGAASAESLLNSCRAEAGNARKSNAAPTTMARKRAEREAIAADASVGTRGSVGDASKKADSRAAEAIQRKNATPYPSSRSPDVSEEKSRLVARTSALKLLERGRDSNGEAQSGNENGSATAARRSSVHGGDNSDSSSSKKSQFSNGEKPTPSTPTPRASSTLSSSCSVGTNRNQGSTAARLATKAKSSTGAVSPALRSTASPKAAANNDDSLITCKVCKRRFTTERITLHEQICAKTSQKKRKQFDTVTHRVRGTELESFVQKPTKKQAKAAAAAAAAAATKPEAPKSNWRRKHEDFINAIRSAKQMQVHLAAGGKLSDLPPPPPSDTSDYVQCPHCSRKFNQAAAERHVPKCETMQHNKPRAQPRSRR